MRRKREAQWQKSSLRGADKQSAATTHSNTRHAAPSCTPNISYHHRGTVPHVIMTLTESSYPAGGLCDQKKAQRHSWRQTTCEKPQEEGEKVEQHPCCFSKWSVHSWRAGVCAALPAKEAQFCDREVRGKTWVWGLSQTVWPGWTETRNLDNFAIGDETAGLKMSFWHHIYVLLAEQK